MMPAAEVKVNDIQKKPQRVSRWVSLRLNTKELIKEVWKFKASYLFLFPFYVLFILFVIVPVVTSVALSFTYYNVLEPATWTGWSNYKLLFVDDDIFITSLKNTLYFALVTGPLSFCLAFFFAWLIHQIPMRMRTFYTTVFYVPSLTSGVAMTVVWLVIFANDSNGYLNQFLMHFGFIQEPMQWLQDITMIMPVIIIISLWMSLGTAFLAFLAGFETINPDLYDAGKVDGIRSRIQELWYITIPSMKPQLLFGAVLSIVGSFKVGEISKAIAGFPSPLNAGLTVILHLQDYAVLRYEMGYASAISVVLFVLIFGAGRLCFRLFQSKGEL
ncbi:carbohydrate ABC transporter permease [Paenibacillus eucommiae]|uniref:Multiple sugar transport system permease protein n=1 Tax=Paenibacillus eucommiae TaxID=1355755 RepID=A0ABS4IN77_9BACL|nr:sugar ABC transporter permease [Paenibacillus eucommiae]MBP1988486.1 multiple sugar transport system permease protein [Paenibacillus eucommiae]